jgi:hypothetical protein
METSRCHREKVRENMPFGGDDWGKNADCDPNPNPNSYADRDYNPNGDRNCNED